MAARIDAVLGAAVGTWATGIVARVEHRGELLFEGAYGATRGDACARPVYVDTRFDLASLTKLFVSTFALQLAQEGRLDLDQPLVVWVPEWRDGPKNAITARTLLAHTSGMASGADYRTLLNDDVQQFALERDLISAPGERVIYSDLGMIALGALIERIEGCALDAVARARVGRPSLYFRPDPCEHCAIPATECDTWRGRVQGTVHDEKAALMGGVAGHAGLFGTASDVAWLTQQFLGALHGRAAALPGSFAAQAVKEAAYDPVLRRGLGWALKTTDENSCGRYFSRNSFGHTGFTGTSVWADPERDLCAVLLTNSVYYGRRDSRPLRVAFYDACVEAVAS